MPNNILQPFSNGDIFHTMEDLLEYIKNPEIFATARLASYEMNPVTGIARETYNVALYVRLPDGSGTGGILACTHIFNNRNDADAQVNKFNNSGTLDYPLLPYTLAYRAVPSSDGETQVTVTAYLELGDFLDNHVSSAVANFVRPF